MSSGLQFGRSSSLDAARGLAVALVVGYHYWPGVLYFGDIGVDLFFVLSGYLIGTNLLDNRIRGGFFSTFTTVELSAFCHCIGFC